MKRIIGLVAASLCCAAPVVQAASVSTYVGFAGSYATGNYDSQWKDMERHDKGKVSNDFDGYGIGLTLGAELRRGPMVEMLYSRASLKPDEADKNIVYHGGEAQIKMPLSKGMARPYVGFGVGFWRHSDTKKYRDDSDRDIVGASASLMAGIIVRANEHLHLDAGLRSRKIWWEKYEMSEVRYEEEDSLHDLYAGVQVRF